LVAGVVRAVRAPDTQRDDEGGSKRPDMIDP
jgi:hypothetical protein